MIAKRESFDKHIKNECEGFIRGSKHRETDESTRPQAKCFIFSWCLEPLMKPEARVSEMTSQTIQ